MPTDIRAINSGNIIPDSLDRSEKLGSEIVPLELVRASGRRVGAWLSGLKPLAVQ